MQPAERRVGLEAVLQRLRKWRELWVPWAVYAHVPVVFILSLLPAATHGQYLLNGDFEINNATPGENEMDMTNAQFGAMVPNCYSFAQPGWAQLDLITTPVWGGTAFSGDWFIGIAWSDRIALRLSESLTVGQTYQVSYHVRGWPRHCVAGLSFGVSTTPNSTGTYIHNAPYTHWPVVGVWKQRVFSFVAPIAAEYLTVSLSSFEGCWQHVDAFCLSATADCATPTVINVPNVFTPNGDEVNDRFAPFAGTTLTSGSMDIYNRWGQLVFTTRNIDKGWDGTTDEVPCPDGVYFYRLSYETVFGDTASRQGYVHLLTGR